MMPWQHIALAVLFLLEMLASAYEAGKGKQPPPRDGRWFAGQMFALGLFTILLVWGS